MIKRGDCSINPVTEYSQGQPYVCETGMTIREYAAIQFMAAMVGKGLQSGETYSDAIILADDLLLALANPPDRGKKVPDAPSVFWFCSCRHPNTKVCYWEDAHKLEGEVARLREALDAKIAESSSHADDALRLHDFVEDMAGADCHNYTKHLSDGGCGHCYPCRARALLNSGAPHEG